MQRVLPFLSGLLFGLGLIVSGMTSPTRVLGFLDVAGQWNPSLAFVMGGAVLSALPLFWLASKRTKPLQADTFNDPETTAIDKRLLAGAVLFGIGWGLAGICPGPVLVDIVLAPVTFLPFIASMLVGLFFSAKVLRG